MPKQLPVTRCLKETEVCGKLYRCIRPQHYYKEDNRHDLYCTEHAGLLKESEWVGENIRPTPLPVREMTEQELHMEAARVFGTIGSPVTCRGREGYRIAFGMIRIFLLDGSGTDIDGNRRDVKN